MHILKRIDSNLSLLIIKNIVCERWHNEPMLHIIPNKRVQEDSFLTSEGTIPSHRLRQCLLDTLYRNM
jgi:hypothetical protein